MESEKIKNENVDEGVLIEAGIPVSFEIGGEYREGVLVKNVLKSAPVYVVECENTKYYLEGDLVSVTPLLRVMKKKKEAPTHVRLVEIYIIQLGLPTTIYVQIFIVSCDSNFNFP